MKRNVDKVLEFFKQYGLKTISIDTNNDEAWVATFESKDGTKDVFTKSFSDVENYIRRMYHNPTIVLSDRERAKRVFRRWAERWFSLNYNPLVSNFPNKKTTMTNKEIKLELAKAALGNKNLLPTDEGLKKLYVWIMEDEEVEVDNKESVNK